MVRNGAKLFSWKKEDVPREITFKKNEKPLKPSKFDFTFFPEISCDQKIAPCLCYYALNACKLSLKSDLQVREISFVSNN